MNIYIVKGYNLGWDDVVGVFDMKETFYDDLLKEFPASSYFIISSKISTLDEFRE